MKFLIIIALLAANLTYSQNMGKQNAGVDSLLAPYDSAGSPGAAVMIIHKGKILYKKGYGLADRENDISVTVNTNFRLASVTKEFTATAIMLLVQRGKLSFDDNLTSIFPGFPEYGKKIKVENLLNHTSGLIAYEDLIPDTATIQVHDKDVLEMMMRQDSTYFEPGTQYRYSNTGYAVLAMIVQKISGEPFAKFLKKNIFEPLGMNNSVAYEKGISEVKNRAFGYSLEDGKWVRTDQSNTSAVLGDGGIYTSVTDMYKWDQNLYTEKILPRKYIEKSFTRGTLNNGDKIDYGYGWHLKTYKDKEVVYHTGSTIGFRNVIYRIPSEHFTVILLTNRDGGDMERIAEKIISLFPDFNRKNIH